MGERGLLILLLAGFCVPANNQIRKHVFVETVKSWSEAQSYCREKHTDLATVRSQEEAEQLLTITGASLRDSWIGLYRDDTQNWQWSNSDDVIYSNWRADVFCASVNSDGKWTDLPCHLPKAFVCYKENEEIVKKAQGKPFWIGLFNEPWKWSHQGDNYTFHRWRKGEPNNRGGGENCVIMRQTGGWQTRLHSSLLCCPLSPGGSSGQCFYEGTKKTWQGAQSYCRNQGRDLPSIQDQARVNKLIGLIPSFTVYNWYWIGLYHDKENWQWSSGGDVIYSNWEPYLFCASVNSEGEWEDSLSHQRNYLMCYSGELRFNSFVNETADWTGG
ncbi:secretory phospholipase A2 receptor-like [Acipenser oxyrinchus oxyrinchus]|uniref:Secretory phospholipase A2 receptor-like n=1 Tax=Acipenser oxyrinchus oxyrinchus TaxID=40147 RepID=A0AAD8CGI5_ACIOX|nr:secretory phospholipase A2 receptor-like [Acipenser oxyrinchus oxyrinchus]KAK1154859.1 secretory phospholipase A2 receptor-like [Acipenser oxyrinchus oxyrinchus]